MDPRLNSAALSAWSLDPPILVALIGVTVLYILTMRKRWPDNRTPPQIFAKRIAFFLGGIIVAFLALQSPLHVWADQYLFSAHMVEHEALTMLTAPLLLLGCPPALLRPIADWKPIRSLVATLTRPAIAAIVFVVILFAWHLPALYQAALLSDEVHGLQHVSFLGGAILFWWPIIDPLARQSLSRQGQLVYVMVASWPSAILGFLFVAVRQPFYPFYMQAPRLLSLSPIDDQQIGGAIMLGIEALILFVALSLLFFEAMRTPSSETAES